MDLLDKNNFFENVPVEFSEEVIEKVIAGKNFILERIVSEQHKSPENFWYDQDRNEFVLLMRGSAELVYEDGQKFILRPGDYIVIPAHKKHRVEKTDEKEKTFWLAIYY